MLSLVDGVFSSSFILVPWKSSNSSVCSGPWVPQLCLTSFSPLGACLFDDVLQLKEGVATQEELDSIKKSVTESYEKDFEVLQC